EDPNRDGEHRFDYLTSSLVLSKAHRKGCRASCGGFPYWLPIPSFICKVLNYFKVHISRFNPFGMVKLTTFAVMCRAYGGEPTVNLLRSFLNLIRAGDWLTLLNRGLKTSWKHSLKEPVIYYRGQEIDFRSFMMELEKDRAYAELERKCNESLLDLEKNPLVADMQTEIETLKGRVDGLHSECLESERGRLKLFEIQLLQEMDALKQDRASIVAKVVPDAATKLIHSDEMDMLVVKLVKASIIYVRCAAFEEVDKLKKTFVIEKMAGYRPFSKQEYDQAGDDLANASGPTISIPHCEKGQAHVIDVISCFGFLGPKCIPQDPSCTSFMMLLAYIGPTHLNHGDMIPSFRYSWMGTIQLSSSSLTIWESLTGGPLFFPAMRSPAMSASLLVVSNLNLNVYIYSFPSGFTNISPAPEPSELEALLVNRFHVFSGSGSFLLAPLSLSSSFSVDDVYTRKSASIRPLIEFLPLNSISCSPNSMAHLATSPDLSGFARTCFIGKSLRTCIGVRLTKYTRAYFFPLSAINTALTFLFEGARYTIKVSPLNHLSTHVAFQGFHEREGLLYAFREESV
nr:hypothetical protein [Tanacetum cinerariifolium]